MSNLEALGEKPESRQGYRNSVLALVSVLQNCSVWNWISLVRICVSSFRKFVCGFRWFICTKSVFT